MVFPLSNGPLIRGAMLSSSRPSARPAKRRATDPPSSGALVAATGAQNVAQLGAPVTHQTHLERNHVG